MQNSKTLWVIAGQFPVGWSIPVYVEGEESGFCRVSDAIIIPKRARETLDMALEAYGIQDQDGWKIPDWALRQIGRIENREVDPEDCFSWGKRKSSFRRAFDEHHPFESEFLRDICELGITPEPDQMELIWAMICKRMSEWLLVQRKPIDFGFVKLHPAPLRPDWQVQMLARRKHGKTPADVSVMSPDLMATGRDGVMTWSVFVEHTKDWKTASERVERQRLKVMGREGYAKNIATYADHAKSRFSRLFKNWIQEIACPPARICESYRHGDFTIVPGKAVKVSEVVGRLASIAASIRGKVSVRKKGSVGEIVAGQAEIVPEMSALQSMENMRGPKPEGHFLREWHQNPDTDGVPVLYAGQELGVGELPPLR